MVKNPLVVLIAALCFVLALDAEADSVGPKEVAQTFIDSYVNAISGDNVGYQAGLALVKSSPHTSEKFKKSLANLYSDALKSDPEMGYGADAVISGQDFPDAGFRVERVKMKGDTARATAKSRDKQFPMDVVMSLVRVDGIWKVDAAGDLLR